MIEAMAEQSLLFKEEQSVGAASFFHSLPFFFILDSERVRRGMSARPDIGPRNSL